jgi:hypothetical protein
MNKSKLIKAIEYPATIVLSIIIGIRVVYDSFKNRLPNEDVLGAFQRILKEDLEMYVWWLLRWTTPTAIGIYILLFILII